MGGIKEREERESANSEELLTKKKRKQNGGLVERTRKGARHGIMQKKGMNENLGQSLVNKNS